MRITKGRTPLPLLQRESVGRAYKEKACFGQLVYNCLKLITKLGNILKHLHLTELKLAYLDKNVAK